MNFDPKSHQHVVFHAIDSFLVTRQSRDKTIRLWSASTGECIRILEGHRDRALSVIFSKADPHLIISGAYDDSAMLWGDWPQRAAQALSCVSEEEREAFVDGLETRIRELEAPPAPSNAATEDTSWMVDRELAGKDGQEDAWQKAEGKAATKPCGCRLM